MLLPYILDLLVNLVSDLTAWMIVIIFAGILYVTRTMTKKRRLVDFLNLSAEKAEFRVYFSSFLIEPDTISDLDNQKAMWRGLTGSTEEFLAVRDIEKWLSPLTTPSTLADYLFSQLMIAKFRLPTICVDYLPSPRDVERLKLTNCTVLCIGGPLHNMSTRLYTSQNLTSMVSLDWNIAVRIAKGKNAGRIFGTNIRREEFIENFGKHQVALAVLEKIEDVERNSVIFIASGTSINGTRAAVNYLTTHWEKMHRQRGKSAFAICLECPHDSVDPAGYFNSTVLFELP